MGVCIVVIVLTAGTLRLETIATQQTDYWLGFIPQWNVFLHPLAFLILIITALAESNRTPFDLAEAEQELVQGYHTEYNGLKFGMFFLGEYAHMITASALISVLFLGGWHFPWFPWTQPEAVGLFAVICKMLVMAVKVTFFIFLMMWLRWTLPRLRFDQLMRVAWKGLIPISLGLFVLATVLLYVGRERNPIWALLGNAVVLGITLLVASTSGTPVTGRQANMPAVDPRSGALAGTKA
jgi:NADH-quinone oxidoreductase subunit H